MEDEKNTHAEVMGECEQCGNIVEDWELDWYDQDYICQDCADMR